MRKLYKRVVAILTSLLSSIAYLGLYAIFGRYNVPHLRW